MIVLASALILGGCAKPAPAPSPAPAPAPAPKPEPITLKAVSFKGEAAMKPSQLFVWIDRINAQAKEYAMTSQRQSKVVERYLALLDGQREKTFPH